MRVLPSNLLIALMISALISFGLWSLDGELHNVIMLGSLIIFMGTLVPLLGFRYENVRRGVNLKALCAVFFVLGLLVNVLFSWVNLGQTSYIITSALLYLVFLLIANTLYGASQ